MDNLSPASESPTPSVPRPRWLLIMMILMSLGYAGVFAFGLFMVLMSPMVFDSGTTTKNTEAFFAILVFPVLILLSVALSWCSFALRRYALIPVGFALPVIYGVAFFLFFS